MWRGRRPRITWQRASGTPDRVLSAGAAARVPSAGADPRIDGEGLRRYHSSVTPDGAGPGRITALALQRVRRAARSLTIEEWRRLSAKALGPAFCAGFPRRPR